MKLSEKQVTKISSHITERLGKSGNLTFKVKESTVRDTIRDVIMENLRAEERLDREVKRLMEAYSRQIEKGEVDSRKMFAMIKSKLAKDKGFVL